MTKQAWLKYSLLIAVVMSLSNVTGVALNYFCYEGEMDCRNQWHNGRLTGYCEIREQPLAMGGRLSVNGSKNGGIAIKGWERGEALMRAKVQAFARTEEEAKALAGQIRIDTAGGQVQAFGPDMNNDQNWAVSFEIFVPRQSDVSAQTFNGGISFNDVRGNLEFEALNGGVSLRRVGGNVRGHTTNGGLHIELSGDRWDGEGLDVKTTNGGVKMIIPENYSARLETGTVNGGYKFDFPITVQGRIGKDFAVNLGNGGPTVRARTTNGGVSISRGQVY